MSLTFPPPITMLLTMSCLSSPYTQYILFHTDVSCHSKLPQFQSCLRKIWQISLEVKDKRQNLPCGILDDFPGLLGRKYADDQPQGMITKGIWERGRWWLRWGGRIGSSVASLPASDTIFCLTHTLQSSLRVFSFLLYIVSLCMIDYCYLIT